VGAAQQAVLASSTAKSAVSAAEGGIRATVVDTFKKKQP
jgi:hypothetical protein